MTGAWLETEEEIIETRADLHRRLGSVLERGDLSEERHGEVLSALAVGDIPVREIMVDRDDVVFLSTDVPPAENFDRMRGTPHVRFPLVADDDPDRFAGIVYAPSVLDNVTELRSGTMDFTDVAAPPMTVAADTSVSDVIDRFQAETQELALVAADGEVVGLVTATDAFEAVMGDLEDPLD